jgi:hypothetical protein
VGEPELHRLLVLGIFAAAGITFVAAGSITAPYGRHARPGWGPGLPVRLGWMLMEPPAVFLFAAVFWAGPRSTNVVPMFLAGLWLAHHGHRTFVYPLTMRGTAGKRMPLLVILMGFGFNAANGYVNARWLSALGPELGLRWLLSVRFLYGTVLFVAGFAINRWADWKLRRLRAPGEACYKIPRGGLFDEVSCPNYFGEIVQWYGWAIATWSLPGAAFAVFTAANLIPRAVSHHAWYRRTFPEYPGRRKAIIPYFL